MTKYINYTTSSTTLYIKTRLIAKLIVDFMRLSGLWGAPTLPSRRLKVIGAGLHISLNVSLHNPPCTSHIRIRHDPFAILWDGCHVKCHINDSVVMTDDLVSSIKMRKD